MAITLVLFCTADVQASRTTHGDERFVMVANDYPTIPEGMLWFKAPRNHARPVAIVTEVAPPQVCYMERHGVARTLVALPANTQGTDQFFEADDVKRAFKELGWTILTVEEAEKQFPFFLLR